MLVVGRPGYRIVCRTIKGGSQVGSLIVSLVERSNHCILASCFFVVVWFYLWVLELMVILMTSLSSSKTEFACVFYDVFDVGRLCRFFSVGSFTPLFCWHTFLASSYYNQSLFWCYSSSCFQQVWVCSIQSSYAEVMAVLVFLRVAFVWSQR